MTLDEAAQHANDRANYSDCIECRNEHEQLALWLEDYSKLIQAKKENRLVILPSKSDEIIRIVEFALKIKLYDWQKAYITGAADYVMPGRVSGKTTAYVVKLCLSEGDPIDLTKRIEIARYADGSHGPHYSDFFKSQLSDIYYELQRIGGLRLRTIYFTKPKN